LQQQQLLLVYLVIFQTWVYWSFFVPENSELCSQAVSVKFVDQGTGTLGFVMEVEKYKNQQLLS
jgi:hypothetical protein